MSNSFSVPYGDGSIYIPEESEWGDGDGREVLIFPVKRGVFLDPLAIRMPGPPCTVILPADSTPTDLSQFKVPLGPASNELCVRACQLLREGLELCSQNSTRIPSGKDADLMRGATVGVLTTCAIIVGTGMAATVPIGIGIGAGIVFELFAKAIDNARHGRARSEVRVQRYQGILEALKEWEKSRTTQEPVKSTELDDVASPQSEVR